MEHFTTGEGTSPLRWTFFVNVEMSQLIIHFTIKTKTAYDDMGNPTTKS